VLQRVAACCSVLQRIAVGFLVVSPMGRVSLMSLVCLLCVAMCCNVLQCVEVCCSVLHRVAACCSMLQRVLQRVAMCCSGLSGSEWVV